MNRRCFLRVARIGCAAVVAGGWARANAERPVPRRSPVPEMDPGSLVSRFVPVRGLRMHMLVSTEHVPPDAPAVVLVHGSGLSAQYMVPTARELAPYFRVYAPDIPGYGDSGDPGRTLDVPQMADWIAAWMSAVGIARASLLGNSFGCQVIAELAVRHPQRVQAAVLQGPTTPPGERSAFWQFIRWRQNQAHNPPWLGEVTNPDYRKAGFLRLVRSFMLQITDRIEAKAPAIEAPTLVVRGTLDPIANQEFCEMLVRLLPRGRLHVMPDVAHTLVAVAPVPLAEVTRAFVREVT